MTDIYALRSVRRTSVRVETHGLQNTDPAPKVMLIQVDEKNRPAANEGDAIDGASILEGKTAV